MQEESVQRRLSWDSQQATFSMMGYIVHKPHSTSVTFVAVSTAVLFNRHETQFSIRSPPGSDRYSASRQTASSSRFPGLHDRSHFDPGTVRSALEIRREASSRTSMRMAVVAERPWHRAMVADWLLIATATTCETNRPQPKSQFLAADGAPLYCTATSTTTGTPEERGSREGRLAVRRAHG
jgi:hypothetical protein